MSNFLPKSIQKLIEEFSRLPGIGPKSAQRLAIHLLYSTDSKVKQFGDAILNLKENIVFCETCWNIAEENPCLICSSEQRDSSIICVVEDVLDVVALEKTRRFSGKYHVLHGALSPIDGVGPDQLKIKELITRVKQGVTRTDDKKLKEIIIATNPSLEGEATALFIQRELKDVEIKITRIARGLPVGGDLEYADEVTLTRALSGRGEF